MAKIIKKKIDINKRMKMTPDEYQEYLHFKKRDFIKPPKKGKGSIYKRDKKVEDD